MADAQLKKDVEKEIQAELAINDKDLPTELKDQSTKFYYYGNMWARAVKAERQQKLLVEALEAELSREFRDLMLQEEPQTRVTEKMIKEYVAGHPKYIEEQKKLIHLGFVADLFNVAKNSFETRGRMLLELSRLSNETRFWNNEYESMKDEFERKEDKKAKKRDKKDPVIDKASGALGDI